MKDFRYDYKLDNVKSVYLLKNNYILSQTKKNAFTSNIFRESRFKKKDESVQTKMLKILSSSIFCN